MATTVKENKTILCKKVLKTNEKGLFVLCNKIAFYCRTCQHYNEARTRTVQISPKKYKIWENKHLSFDCQCCEMGNPVYPYPYLFEK